MSEADKMIYQNRDGLRNNDGRYDAFERELGTILPKSRQFTDPVHTFAYGTDASFYRLNPKMVVKVNNEEEMIKVRESLAMSCRAPSLMKPS